ncbi:Lysine-specific demethylase rsbn1l [Saguinus oedipus]|uniref:Lysine-specific demethylase rsbn1l n=1 Tax=Saguinus oedipus TaxID=9490 RepID=A0ABQ9UH64_SAGOE|nr:Lysine-specific demethylase rsbn1l [Saguinus oedipus]
MAEPRSPVHGVAAAAPTATVSEKEPFGKLQPSSRDPPGPLSTKKVRTEEKKAPRRVNGEGGSGGNSRQLQPPATPSPQSYGSPASWSFATLSAAPSPSSSRSSFSFSAGTAVPSASASLSQPVPRKLLVPPTLLHAQPHHLLPAAAAASANAKSRRPKEKREKEKRRHGLGGVGEAGGTAREENGEVKPLPRGGCRTRGRGEGAAGPGNGECGGRVRQPGPGGRRSVFGRGFCSSQGDRKWSL